MNEETYQFFLLDLSNRKEPTAFRAHCPLKGKGAAYKKLRQLHSLNTHPHQVVMMRLPKGGLRAINPKGEIIPLAEDTPAKKLQKLLPVTVA